jgi:TetR/AcrR family transcriptional regulator
MAAIAEASGLPKANLHYYFGSKEVLYREVLARILNDWLLPTHGITVDADPKTALTQYIRAKMELSAQRPDGSKVWANELLHGAPVVKSLLATELRTLLLEKAAVVQAWVDAKRMAKVDGIHLFFTIWAATQTYADFDVQICAVLEQDALTPKDFERATEHVVSLILRGCGL